MRQIKRFARIVVLELVGLVVVACSSSSGGSPDVVVVADDAGVKDCAATVECQVCGWCTWKYGWCTTTGKADCAGAQVCTSGGCCAYDDIPQVCVNEATHSNCNPACVHK